MASASREFDPNKKYKVVLSERLKKENDGGYNYTSVQGQFYHPHQGPSH